MSIHRGPTAFLRFRTDAPFDFKLSVFDGRFHQGPDGSKEYYTANRVLRRQVEVPGAPVRVMAPAARLRSLPVGQWARDYGRQRVLFILPSDALGDCVGVVLFLRAFRRRFPQAEVTVANTGGATDIFGREPGLRVLPLLISERELDRAHPIIDLGEVDGWDAVTTQPVDMETVLLQRFGLVAEDVPPRPRPAGPASIALLPMASSPLRTLPPAVTAAVAAALAPCGQVRVVLNSYQGVKQPYERALLPLLPPGVAVVPGFATTGGLLDFLAAQDFVVVADSGPAHLTKLFGTPGLAVYTSASGEVLQGRHRNLQRWQVAYAGRHCTAPCGLAKLRAAVDGRIGCMGSLDLPLDQLPVLPGEAQPALAEELTLVRPVPCVARLVAERQALAAAALRRLQAL